MNIINTFRRAKKSAPTDKLLFYAPLDNANGKNATVNKLGSLTPTSAGSGYIAGAYVLDTYAGNEYTDLTYEFDTALLSTLGYGDNVVIGLWTRVSPNATRNMLSDFIIKKDSSSYAEASHDDTYGCGIYMPWYTQGYNDIGHYFFVNTELRTGAYHFIMFKMTTTELQQFYGGRFLGDNSGNIIENVDMSLSSTAIRGWKFNTLSIGITTRSTSPPVGIASHGRAHLQVWSDLTTAEMQAVYENEVPPTPLPPT